MALAARLTLSSLLIVLLLSACTINVTVPASPSDTSPPAGDVESESPAAVDQTSPEDAARIEANVRNVQACYAWEDDRQDFVQTVNDDPSVDNFVSAYRQFAIASRDRALEASPGTSVASAIFDFSEVADETADALIANLGLTESQQLGVGSAIDRTLMECGLFKVPYGTRGN